MYKAEYYQIPTAIDETLAAHIKKTVKKFAGEREKSMVGGELGDGTFGSAIADLSLRNSTNRWIPTDNWIAGMMAHFVREANLNYFKFDLIGWADRIQYTEYNGPGTHYSWHADSNPSLILPGSVRKMSISLLLSAPDEYEGGEFQLLKQSGREMVTFKPELGQAIIFPSYLTHRVRPIKSGNRVSLVGWYAGPPFR